MPYAQQLEKLRLDGPAGIGPDVLVIPNDQLAARSCRDCCRR
jgi:arabinogalactan oligomer/maltooligosaccharide transport system substrate-binding protein